MSLIKNLDTINSRGNRVVAEGIQTPLGLTTLKGFDFNNHALLSSLFFNSYTVNNVSGEIVLTDLIPQQDLISPQGATHVEFSCGFVGLDFGMMQKDLQLSTPVTLPIDQTQTTVTLTPTGIPSVGTTKLFLLKIAFFQLINGTRYSMKNGAYNALQIVEVL